MGHLKHVPVSQHEIDRAKTCDLLALAERYTALRHIAGTGGGEYAGPCPLCPGGDDRFHVQPVQHRWMCRHCTGGQWQDAITFQMRLARQGFIDAVRALAGEALYHAPVLPVAAAPQPPTCPPAAGWQARARCVISRAVDNLWSPGGARVRDWLHARGLQDETLQRWRIGYIPTDRHEAAWRWGLPAGRAIYLPKGILIPGEVQGTIWYAKIRKLGGRPKYTQIRGSRAALYMAETIRGDVACVTEGELDAQLLAQQLQQATDPRLHAVGVVTPGSASMHLDLQRWGQWFVGLKHLFVLYDQDAQGDEGALHWMVTSPVAHTAILRCPVLRPGNKDITDYHLAGGDLVALVSGAVSPGIAGGIQAP